MGGNRNHNQTTSISPLPYNSVLTPTAIRSNHVANLFILVFFNPNLRVKIKEHTYTQPSQSATG
jgi:hypothetical protein